MNLPKHYQTKEGNGYITLSTTNCQCSGKLPTHKKGPLKGLFDDAEYIGESIVIPGLPGMHRCGE